VIQSVGFTTDGQVFINLVFEMPPNGQKTGATLTMERDFARKVAADMVEAAEKAGAAAKTGNPRQE